MNECIDKTHDCHVNAFCTDAEESFTCTCKPGYTGDGKTCSGMYLSKLYYSVDRKQ